MMKLLNKIVQQKTAQRQAEMHRALLNYEAKIGASIFGSIPEGHRREFFCLDEHTWVWHEEWLDQYNHRQAVTTRYDVRPDGILKLQTNQSYQRLSQEETVNLYRAAKIYCQTVGAELQRLRQIA